MAGTLDRRSLLRGLLLLAAGLLIRPKRAVALGGVLPTIAEPAPDFDLAGVSPDRQGEPLPTRLKLADFGGSWLVLYFYPRDFTSGCTLEARGFQRIWPPSRPAGRGSWG